MMEFDGYHDLNIDASCAIDDELWDTLFDYKTKIIALNQTVDCTEVSRKRKKGEKQDDTIPEPKKLEVPDRYKGKFMVLNRLTIKFSDTSQWYKVMKSKNIKRYHLLAAIPANGNALHHCCSTGDADIVTFEPESKPDWKISRKIYKMAVSRNVFFEINYGPAVLDSSCRRNTIQLCQSYHTHGKSKNIIISSSLTNPFHIRSPYDIIHLSALFDLSEGEAKNAIIHNPKCVLQRAASRLQGKAVFRMVRAKTDKESESEDDETELENEPMETES
ncbi:ribonuclease P protein subunit p30 [Cimex lectularius]|uniref:Uncharacterized protein n=1 Tax=Cimex lectularius TaxID=79782 RepID=A0A8I6RUL4_CIMLE|nr:ribonuclease P protein subunit p30 [Cimex lectularius]XP_014251689.1 ribonuclease P protein subunit p30 [Cimex lectularius]XP_014251690.1 ribonuclease P protein subunit p30 [Cimex lectularius]